MRSSHTVCGDRLSRRSGLTKTLCHCQTAAAHSYQSAQTLPSQSKKTGLMVRREPIPRSRWHQGERQSPPHLYSAGM